MTGDSDEQLPKLEMPLIKTTLLPWQGILFVRFSWKIRDQLMDEQSAPHRDAGASDPTLHAPGTSLSRAERNQQVRGHDICHPISDIYESDREHTDVMDSYIRTTGISRDCPWDLGY